MYNSDDISFFLSCGFMPTTNENSLFTFFNKSNLEFRNNIEFKKDSESDIISEGVKALKKSFINIEGGEHIVPLSGGLDSRLILAELIDAGIKDKITAVTFGIPNSYDYEIPKLLTKKLGIKHVMIDLNRIEIENELLIDIAKKGSSHTFLFDAFYNSLINKKFGNKVIYWSGFVGGGVAGVHIPFNESETWIAAKKLFLKKNRIFSSINLSKPNYNIEDSLPLNPFLDRSIMSYDDQLHFGLRQQNYIKKVVIFDEFKYRTPFLNDKWVDFMFSIPREYRINNYIYKKILLNAHPILFSLPTTNNIGGSLYFSRHEYYYRKLLNLIYKKTKNYNDFNSKYLIPLWKNLNVYDEINYINFNYAIRNRQDYNVLVRNNIRDLKERSLVNWLDLDQIVQDHLSEKSDYGLPLILLSALEISLKSQI